MSERRDAIPPGASYEPKWDGFRSICFRDGDEVELGSRNERPLTRYFPELVAAAVAELPSRCVIDGEIVIATDSGLDFEALQLRLHPAASRVRMLAEQTPAHFIAFDLLALGGDDGTLASVGVIGAFPMAERRRLFTELQPIVTTFDNHPWNWASHMAGERTPRKNEGSRWNAGKYLSFVPLRPERVVEVRYDRMEGERFRHTAQFNRWRPDRDPRSCAYAQLEQPLTFSLGYIVPGLAPGNI